MLINLLLSDIANACDGQLVGPDITVSEVITDTRVILPQALFVALKGARFDGHDYAVSAVQQGVVAVLCERDLSVPSYIKVADTQVAYGRLARLMRDAFSGPVVAITGSNGKTSVKDWLAQSLDDRNVLKTRANLNNQIGVPQTILSLNDHHDVAVIEAGTSFTGEIALLANIIHPDIVILTNASGSHFEGLGGLENIAIEKGCLLSGATEEALLILNADDAYFDYWCGLASGRQIWSFGFSDQATLYASELSLGAESSQALFHFKGQSVGVTVAGAGKHQIANGMAVVLALVGLGMAFEIAVEKLSQPVLVSGRLERRVTKNGALLIDDCYNASPTSVQAAIDVLVMQPVKQTWFILGALGELGSQRDDIHHQIGVYAQEQGVSHLICVGHVAGIAGKAFEAKGGCAVFCDTHADAAEKVRYLDKQNAILVKGSRSAKMETVIEALIH
ncbi:UDP-N-acetylmuramoyl-tripeptide--D-alanyl-D-alanine ligase [Marinomonas sp. A79]|uniref:UDP-N-acetylmuramoyl-tripeptide--D-alanyl-D-alanine ligase n=1 Tax=Marinomonas vulgaris TaxID=2823372 RepID=A0ABS5HDK8_9GAMM|nr:UDP-N-acetylmuramoyl-tripeptide--D-alanyl-D-alanine ligase [Marinomonas vulgaris]MBR7889721.1 UDP-N-acetylmuramoyl-tripeptide--D-alanyl-D-alanine ligase [Marinomonas vulgaris]